MQRPLAQASTADDFSFAECLQSLPKKKYSTLWQAAAAVASGVIASEDHGSDDDRAAKVRCGGGVSLPIALLRRMVWSSLPCLCWMESRRLPWRTCLWLNVKRLPHCLSSAVPFTVCGRACCVGVASRLTLFCVADILFTLSENGGGLGLQNHISQLCELWWSQKRPSREQLVPQTISYVLIRSLQDDAKAAGTCLQISAPWFYALGVAPSNPIHSPCALAQM